jgi:D-lactate dehydrogenase (cytochrome)
MRVYPSPYLRARSRSHAAVPPFAVIHPKSTEEVSKALQICSRYALPVVAYGSGTSLEGHTTVPTGGVTMSFSEMTAIKSVNASDMDCVVEPGITWTALNEALKPHGLFFPVDPGPGASIGGMVSALAEERLCCRNA